MMAYDPKISGEFERSRAYAIQWIGLPASVIWLALEIIWAAFSWDTSPYDVGFVPAIFAAGSLAWPLGTMGAEDEFIRRQHLTAASWGVAMAGLMGLLQVFPFMDRLFPAIGASLAIAIIATAYNTALFVVRLKD